MRARAFRELAARVRDLVAEGHLEAPRARALYDYVMCNSWLTGQLSQEQFAAYVRDAVARTRALPRGGVVLEAHEEALRAAGVLQ